MTPRRLRSPGPRRKRLAVEFTLDGRRAEACIASPDGTPSAAARLPRRHRRRSALAAHPWRVALGLANR